MEAKEAQSENIEKNPLTAGSQMKQLRAFVGWGLDDTDHRCTLPMPSVAAGLSCAGPVVRWALSQRLALSQTVRSLSNSSELASRRAAGSRLAGQGGEGTREVP